MKEIQNIVILTGAGVSAESGIDTFRDGGGLWEQHRVEDVATPAAFVATPTSSTVSMTRGAKRSRRRCRTRRMTRWRGSMRPGRANC